MVLEYIPNPEPTATGHGHIVLTRVGVWPPCICYTASSTEASYQKDLSRAVVYSWLLPFGNVLLVNYNCHSYGIRK